MTISSSRAGTCSAGDVTPRGDVLFFDDNGTHSALSAAELIARSGANLEIVTPERMFAVEVGGLNHVPYARAFNECETRITLHQKVLAVRRVDGDGSRSSSAASSRSIARAVVVDWVVVDHGTAALDELYFDLKPASSNLGAVDYGALMEGRPQSLVRNPEGGVPAVPDRRRSQQSQRPRRRLRRAAIGEGSVNTDIPPRVVHAPAGNSGHVAWYSAESPM